MKSKPAKQLSEVLVKPGNILELLNDNLLADSSFTITFDPQASRDHYFINAFDAGIKMPLSFRSETLYGAFIGVLYNLCSLNASSVARPNYTWNDFRHEYRENIIQSEIENCGFLSEINKNLQYNGELSVTKIKRVDGKEYVHSAIKNTNYSENAFTSTGLCDLKEAVVQTDHTAEIINRQMQMSSAFETLIAGAVSMSATAVPEA